MYDYSNSLILSSFSTVSLARFMSDNRLQPLHYFIVFLQRKGGKSKEKCLIFPNSIRKRRGENQSSNIFEAELLLPALKFYVRFN